MKCLPQRLPHLFTLGSHVFSGLWVLLPGSPAFYFCLFASSFLAMSDFPSKGFLPSPSVLPLHGFLAHVHMTLCLAQRQASGLCCTFGVAAASVAWPSSRSVPSLVESKLLDLDAKNEEFDLFHFCLACCPVSPEYALTTHLPEPSHRAVVGPQQSCTSEKITFLARLEHSNPYSLDNDLLWWPSYHSSSYFGPGCAVCLVATSFLYTADLSFEAEWLTCVRKS